MALLLFMAVYLCLVHRYANVKHPALPQNAELQRPPGQSLIIRLERNRRQIIAYGILLLLMLALYGAGFASLRVYTDHPIQILELTVSGLLGAVLWSYVFYRQMRLMLRRNRLKLGLAGEVEVGEQLHQLSVKGCHVLHEFPADQFNISHVVVGEKGVFAVETKARSKPAARMSGKHSIVEYNGKVLYFPNEKDLETVEQAEYRANWLSDWLGKTAGQPVAVRAMVAIPGWTVKRTSAEGIPVVNPRQFSSLFDHIHPRPLSKEAVEHIVRQLEQRCRTADPLPTG